MKSLYWWLACILLSAQLDAAKGKICQSADHCREDECCMTKSSMVGGCRPMGCPGCSCVPNNMKSHLGDMYLMACPCSEGLECVPEAILKNPANEIVEYINSTCQKVEPTASSHFSKDSPAHARPSLIRKLLKLEA